MKLRALVAGAAVLVLAALSLDAGNGYLARQAVERVARAEGLAFERVIVDPLQGRARVIDANWRASGLSIHIAALDLRAEAPLFWPIAPAMARTDSASAEDVTIESGPSIYRIKRIDLSGSSLSTSELAQILDPKSTAPIAERLSKISAASVIIPEIIAETKFGATTQKIVYRDIALNGLEQGKAAAASASGASFSISDPQRGEAEGAYGQINAKAIDLVVAARILTQTRDNADAPKLPLYQALTVDGFHLTNAKAQFALNVKSITATGVKGRPPRKPWTAVQPPDPSSPQAEKPSAFLAEILDSFEIDDVAAGDIRLSLLANGDSASFTFSRISMSQLGGTTVNAIELQNLGFTGAAGKISLEGLTLRGVDFKTYGATDNPSSNALPLPNLIEKDLFPGFDQIVLTRLDVDLTQAQSGEPASGASSGGAFKADRFEVDGKKEKDGGGAGLDLTLDHLTAPVDESGPFAILAAMGYDRLDLSSRLKLAWTEASRELEIKTFSLEGADMGTVNIAGLIGNVTSDLGSSDESVAAEAARNVLLKKLDLHVENAGIVDKALAVQAKNQNKSVDATRHADEMVLSLVLPALLGSDPPARALGAALAKFIADPKTFHLVAVSPQGLGLADLDLIRTPSALFSRVEIEASANQ
jgi:hypothetical protein